MFVFDLWFLIVCTSSQIVTSHGTAASSSAFASTIPYVVSTTSHSRRAAARSASSFSAPWHLRTRKQPHVVNSRCQLASVDVGATTSTWRQSPSANGKPRSRSSRVHVFPSTAEMNPMVCTVLPSPISSPNMPPRSWEYWRHSHAIPSFWYGRRYWLKLAGRTAIRG